MSYCQRKELFGQWIEIRNRPLITYVTSVRPNLSVNMSGDAVPEIISIINTISSDYSDIDFMIIRAGHGLNINDTKFERNYTYAKRYGIPLGVYLYANAQNVDEAKAEANHLLNLLKGKKFELPIYYDVEAQENVDINTITAMCNEFYKVLKNAGYKPGIYASKYYLLYKIYPNKLPADCSVWVASYGKNDGSIPKDAYKYYGRWDIWQYTSTGRIAGISGDVDYDVSYKIP